MSQPRPVLSLLHDLVDDFTGPGFIWQVVALLVCLAAAYLVARWWRARQVEGVARLNDVGIRLAFPLTGMVLSGLAILLLGQWMPVNLLKLAMPLLGSMVLVRSVVFTLRQTFPRATWLTTWERVIATTIWLWMTLLITDLAPIVIQGLEQVEFKLGKQRVDLWMILSGIAMVIMTLVFALWLAGVIERRLMGMHGLDGNLRMVGVRVVKAVLTVVALLASLSLVGIDMTALSVFTGALGVGLGFGLQKIASNYVAGFIILLDRSIRIGNIVQVGADAGEVTQITTRYTVLKHPAGTEFIVPNEVLVGTTVQNQSYSDHRLRLATTVGVAYDCDLERAMQLMLDCATGHPRVLDDPPPKVMLTLFADSAINLELGFWIADPEAGKMNVISDLNLAIWKSFCANGVSIPFPQREVRIVGEASANPVSA